MVKAILVIITILLMFNISLAEDWIVQTVDNEGDAGVGTKMWVDSLGYPHVIYRTLPSGNLYYTKWNGSGWDRQYIPIIVYDHSEGVFDVVLDSIGNPHIAVYNYDYGHHLNYGYLSDDEWSITNLSAYGQPVSITLDSNGYPHIAQGYNQLIHSYLDSLSAQWVNETITTESCDWKSIAIDDSNHIYIAYHTSGSSGHLKLAYFDGNEWGTQYITTEDNTGSYCELILDENGVPHIAYYDAANTRLMYATWDEQPITGRNSSK